MSQVVDITGQRFGRLIVLRRAGSNRFGRAQWRCRCICGRTTTVLGKRLRSGHTQSCRCLFRDAIRESRMQTHSETVAGQTSAEYRAWNGMLDRCTNPRTRSYKRYGARGIGVSRRWLRFEAFLQDMGRRPSSRHSLDRKNNDRGYSKRNCHWATPKEQQRNTRRNHLITFKGHTAPLIVWAERRGMKKQTLRMRLVYGWSTERALMTPVQEKRR